MVEGVGKQSRILGIQNLRGGAGIVQIKVKLNSELGEGPWIFGIWGRGGGGVQNFWNVV